MVDDGVVVYAAAVAAGGPAIARRPPLDTRGGRRARRCRRRRFLRFGLLVSYRSILLVRRRFWSPWNRDRAAASAGTSSRGRWYYIEEGFRAMVASADPNRASPEPSSGSSDEANGRTTYVISKL